MPVLHDDGVGTGITEVSTVRLRDREIGDRHNRGRIARAVVREVDLAAARYIGRIGEIRRSGRCDIYRQRDRVARPAVQRSSVRACERTEVA